jgi:hypothetical protein
MFGEEKKQRSWAGGLSAKLGPQFELQVASTTVDNLTPAGLACAQPSTSFCLFAGRRSQDRPLRATRFWVRGPQPQERNRRRVRTEIRWMDGSIEAAEPPHGCQSRARKKNRTHQTAAHSTLHEGGWLRLRQGRLPLRLPRSGLGRPR